MRRMKKITAIVTATVMVLCMSLALYAADTGSITINNAVAGQTYTAYRIFDLASYNAEAGAYLYTVNAAWEAFISGSSINGVYVTVNDQTGVTWVENADVDGFAALAMEYVTKQNLSSVGSVTAETSSASITGLEFGYYLVDTSLGSLCSLSNVNADVTVVEKNSEPMVQPLIGDAISCSSDIGGNVSLDAVVTVGSTTTNYVLHIEYGSGLTCKISNPYRLNDSGNKDTFGSSGYSVDTTANGAAVTIKSTLKEGEVIHVPVTVTVGTNAVVGSNGNPVKTWLTYGSSSSTAAAVNTIYTWDLPIFKYTGTNTPLSDAEFTITRGESQLTFEQVSDTQVYIFNSNGSETKITTDSSGRFILRGLASGTYTITETAAPEGFSLLSEPVTVVIGEDGSLNATAANPGGVTEIKVLNQSGTLLPETGGIGTPLIVCIGFAMFTVSGILFVTSLRTNGRRRV